MWKTTQFQRSIHAALNLQKRGEARTDGLKLRSVCTRMEVTWSAREIHPWDRQDSPERKAARFVHQAFQDAEEAIVRLFKARPEVDVITVSVLEGDSGKVIMAGTVHRSSLVETASSVKMRLMNWGIRFVLAGSGFEPMAENNG